MRTFDLTNTQCTHSEHSLSSYYGLLQPEIFSLERLVEAAPLSLSERGELAQIIAIRFSSGASRALSLAPTQ
ncbi:MULTISPECIES: hypothetical protein [unclassified Pseudovibrio]|uniref:hypothetical protein n=1 Tax=unclassified Pseudovibrio TaxID=2627060 RepID=UPI0007AE3F0A|nr:MULTISPECIES: hypothetical protein [unclassified Pseudovibrio]KZL00463.1 hypothetical protein PsW74_02888 [Pseudovibrio sp. W74]KZL07463.1 hypothetical protein PsAD14_03848 [Pseudovibrio sp. Ad14]